MCGDQNSAALSGHGVRVRADPPQPKQTHSQPTAGGELRHRLEVKLSFVCRDL